MSNEITVSIAGSAGGLDARVHNQNPVAGLIMCHPHPLFAGTMDNKVVTTVVRSARDLGLSTLRFNFRGTGNSEGTHDHGRGEVEDVLSVLRYAHDTLGWQKVILAGFSFGAGMACLAACRDESLVDALILLAPAVHHFDAPTTLPFGLETWVMMGDDDEVVPFDEVDSWVQRLVPQPHWHIFNGAGHFFHGRLGDLKEVLSSELSALTGQPGW